VTRCRRVCRQQLLITTEQVVAITVDLPFDQAWDDAALPLNKHLVEIDVPDRVWLHREEVNIATLPATWAAIPAGRGSVTFGSDWLASLRSPILLVPSVIVPEEPIALINPAHADATRLSAKVLRLFEYNRMFRS